jgi:hypothetical protein
MPSIPLYGFDQLDPSVLNNAKRRIVGLMDTSQEALTEKADKDPTGGKQNGFVEKLTEEIYATIKDIEVLDSYISDASSITELRLLNRADKSSLKLIRTELKKSASQIASVNNDLRRINATYDKLRPNMVYTDLKIFTFFTNSVKILKQSALTFFNIVDTLIEDVIKTEDPTSTYVKPPINEDDEDIEAPPIEADPSISGVPIGSVGTEPPIDYAPTQIPAPPFPEPPLPPQPPPPKRGSLLFKRRMKKYKELVDTLLQQNNIGDQNEKDNVLRFALDYERTNNAFATEQELQDYIDANIMNVPQGTPAPLTETFSDMVDRITANLSQQEQIEVGKNIGTYINQFQREPTELEVQDIITQVINPKGSSSSTGGVPIGTPLPAQGVPVGQPQDLNALFSASAQLKPKITQIGVAKLERNENFLRDAISAGDTTAITKFSNKLQTIITIGNKAFIKISTSDIKNLSTEEKKELTKLENAYRAAKQNLSEKTTQRDELTDFLDEKGIGYKNPA